MNNMSQLTARMMAAARANSILVNPPLLKPPPIFNNWIVSTSIPNRCMTSTSLPSSIGNCSSNPCLDLFFNVNRPSEYKDYYADVKLKKSEIEARLEASCSYLKQLLPLAWSQNPRTTLKLIYHLLHDKGYQEAYHAGLDWLHHNHPKTLLRNIEPVAYWFDCFYELTQIPYFLLEAKRGREKAVEFLENDLDYRLLRDKVADVLAECLKSDLDILKKQKLKVYDTNWIDCEDSDSDSDEEEYEKVTDAVHYCLIHSENNAHARSLHATLLLESIAKKVFTGESFPGYQGVEEGEHRNRAVDLLKKEVLVPLHKYHTGSRTSRSFGGKHFNVDKYLKEVKAGEAKIVADALLPNEIIKIVDHWDLGGVAELQWRAMVEGMKKKGQKGNKILNNCLAVCDLPWSLEEYENRRSRREVSLGLTLLASELNEEPWKGKVILFNSSSNNLHLIQGEDLRYKCEFLRKTHRDDCTDFEAVLDLLLQVAVNENLKPEHMIKKVLVFGRNNDDDPFSNNSCWEAKYRIIQKKYKEKGYRDVVPHIVYWTLSQEAEDEQEKPMMPRKLSGVTILTGYSNDLVKSFLEKNAEVEPENVMEFAISGEEYQSLSVVD